MTATAQIDRQLEQREEALLENKLYTDLEFALEYFGIDELQDKLDYILTRMQAYGWEIDKRDILLELS